MLWMAGPARAQAPLPALPTDNARNGLITRYAPVQPKLPHDPDRDDYYITRRVDHPPRLPNSPFTSGLYGLRFPDNCVECYSPYFRGYPGQSSVTPDCKPPHPRIIMNFFHPWRPVGAYYDGGGYSPIYDLDPISPGPGPFPWQWIYHRQMPGG